MAKQFSCPSCGFMIQSDDNNEVVEMVQKHAGDAHDMEMSRQDIQKDWEDV